MTIYWGKAWNIEKIKKREAAGLDKMPSEVWMTRKFSNILPRWCNVDYEQNLKEEWTKGFIIPFPKKGHSIISKSNRGTTVPTIAAKVHNNLFLNCIPPKTEKYIRKNQILQSVETSKEYK